MNSTMRLTITIKMVCKNHNRSKRERMPIKSNVDAVHSERFRKKEAKQGEEEGEGGKREKGEEGRGDS